MVPGHKFKCDGSFGLIKKLYRKTTVDCVDHIVEVVKKSSTAGFNQSQFYHDGKGFQYLDLNSVLGIFFKKLSILYSKQLDLVLSKLANGSFYLLKTRKATVSEIIKEIKSFSILVLTLLLWITKNTNIFITISSLYYLSF